MKPLILGTLLASLAVFVWGALFWATPLSAPALQHAPDAPAVAATLAAQLPATGTYFLPDPAAGAMDADAWAAQHRAGPLVTIHYRRAGAEPMSAATFALGFLQIAAAMLLVALLLRRVASALGGYGARVAFVVLLGVLGVVWSNLGQPIWYFYPWTYPLFTSLYDVVAFALGGAILARFVVPKAQRAYG